MTSRARPSGSGTTRPLLFERLVEAGPAAGAGPYKQPDNRAAAEASVAREIGALLGTRIDPSVDTIEPRERTVLDYGLPDFTGLAPASATDRERLARTIERAITAFEPRLARPSVSVLAGQNDAQKLTLAITGVLTVNAVSATFTFPVHLGTPEGGDGL